MKIFQAKKWTTNHKKNNNFMSFISLAEKLCEIFYSLSGEKK